MSPEEWCCKYECGILTPQNKDAATSSRIPSMNVYCECKTGASCWCWKSGLNGTVACSACDGDSCTNPSPVI